MARRKKGFLSDGSDSEGSADSGVSEGGYNSQEDGDSRAERALFEYNGNKRRKMRSGGKASAWEGVFGDEDEGGHRGLGARGPKATKTRSDWTKAPAFVSSAGPSKAAESEEADKVAKDDGNEIDDDDDNEDDSDDSEESEASAPPSPRVRDDDYDDSTPQPRAGLGGLGFKEATGLEESAPSSGTQSPAPEASGSARPQGSHLGIGADKAAKFSRRGIGARKAAAEVSDPSEQLPPVSSFGSFGRQASVADAPAQSDADRVRQNFRGRDSPAPVAKPTELTAAEAAHFKSIQSDFGFKFLQKAGWNAGEGLGKDRAGRAVPVAVGKILRGKGITSGIRTEDSKREARRKGEVFSDDEDDEAPKRRGGKPKAAQKPQQDQSWKKQKKIKVKVEHKTYEQLLAEAGDAQAGGVGLVLDARGGELKEVQSLSALNLSGWTPTADNAQLPELRHNLRLIVDVAKADVDALAREGKSVNERRRWAVREETLARNRMEDIDQRLTRLESIQVHISDISTLASAQASQHNPTLAPLTKSFDALVNDFKIEYVSLNLDEVVVGAISQVLRSTLADWQPFDMSSDVLLSSLKQWKHAYRLQSDKLDPVNKGERVMTAWESFLWSSWLPKVRSAINNEWSASSPQAAVHLLESWDPILPAFVRDNILDQLVLPKVKQAVEEWDGRPSRSGKKRSLAGIVFPWLPLLGARLEEILDGSKRRIRQVLRKWVPRDGVPEELARWRKDIFSSREWDEVMLRSVVPKLGACLRDEFTINPRKQDMVPLEEWVLPWHTLIRGSTFVQLLEANFFPKWLDILYIWLIQPNFNSDEVATWFKWWKDRFPEAVRAMPGVSHGFTTALNLMQDAMRLGTNAPSQLRKPIYEPPKHSSKSSITPKAAKPVQKAQPETADITFRSLAEDLAAQNDLLFLPLGRSHDLTGKPLFKVGKTVDGRGGITVYVGEDAVFAQGEDGYFRATSLEDMVKRASA